MSERFLGIDKTKGGWVVAATDGSAITEVAYCADLASVVAQWSTYEAVGIDIPLYLVARGSREAERELRSLLGPSARSMFTSPTVAALAAPSQAEATAANRAIGGPGISAQSFGLFSAIAEARQTVATLPTRQRDRWFETHPESAFVILAQSHNQPPPPSKRSATGVLKRIELLRAEFGDTATSRTEALPSSVRIDDVLDAMAAAWSAQRAASGTALHFGSGTSDADGWKDVIVI